MPTILICALMLVLWIRYEVNKSRNIGESSSQAFWKREEEANHTRNKSLDSLTYITVPQDDLPLEETTDPELSQLQATLIEIASKDIINLSDYTNTELKLAYGTGNFTYLAGCDENYSHLLKTLAKLGAYHTEHGQIESAIVFYEYAIHCNSENIQTYVNLAKLYSAQDNSHKLTSLRHQIEQSPNKNKALLLRRLDQLQLEELL